jgi:hypothetical protein
VDRALWAQKALVEATNTGADDAIGDSMAAHLHAVA